MFPMALSHDKLNGVKLDSDHLYEMEAHGDTGRTSRFTCTGTCLFLVPHVPQSIRE